MAADGTSGIGQPTASTNGALTSFPLKKRGECIFQVVFGGIDVSLLPRGELVVDPAVIPHLSVFVDHERLGCHFRPELPRQGAPLVASDRELQAEIAGVALDVGVTQVGVDANADPFDLFGGEALDQVP